jgi:hypothetical protein
MNGMKEKSLQCLTQLWGYLFKNKKKLRVIQDSETINLYILNSFQMRDQLLNTLAEFTARSWGSLLDNWHVRRIVSMAMECLAHFAKSKDPDHLKFFYDNSLPILMQVCYPFLATNR